MNSQQHKIQKKTKKGDIDDIHLFLHVTLRASSARTLILIGIEKYSLTIMMYGRSVSLWLLLLFLTTAWSPFKQQQQSGASSGVLVVAAADADVGEEGEQQHQSSEEQEEETDSQDHSSSSEDSEEEEEDASDDDMNESATIECDTTKGIFQMTLYRDWSPYGYDRAVELFEKGYYDHSHFFRVGKYF